MVLLILPRKAKMSPSCAMAYMHRGREKREPSKVVVIPQSAPIVTAYLTQCRPIMENASGRAALASIIVYGTMRVNAALTRMYPEKLIVFQSIIDLLRVCYVEFDTL